MEKARDKFKIGQLVVILVHNSHHGDIGQVVGFGQYNEYNVKVSFEGNEVQGYMVNELKPIPRLGQKVSIKSKILKFLANSFKSCKNWKELNRIGV